MNRFPYNEVVASKLPSSFPNYVGNNIKIMSINKNKSSVVGSFSFSYPQFPSDIDVRELIDEGDTKDQVIRYFMNGIKMKVNEIEHMPDYWMMEVKIGFDDRFNFSVSDKSANHKIAYLYKNNLINEEELAILQNDNEEVADLLLQNLSKIRWSTSDINNGYKILRGNKVIQLKEVVPMRGVINMEVIGISNGKFTDLSNFFALVYHDQNGKLKSINLPDDTIDDFSKFFTTEVKGNIKKLYYSKIGYDYAKMIKRLFSLGRFTGDKQLVNKVYPYLNSVTALAGQKKSEIALLMKLIEHTQMNGIPIHVFINQLGNIKMALSNVIDLDREVLEKINYALDQVAYGQLGVNSILEYLGKVKKILSEYVNIKALAYLKKVGLAPPPKKYIN